MSRDESPPECSRRRRADRDRARQAVATFIRSRPERVPTPRWDVDAVACRSTEPFSAPRWRRRSRPSSCPPSRSPTRSATSRSTITRACASSPTGSCSMSSSTRPRSRPSRHVSTSTSTGTARSPSEEIEAGRVARCDDLRGVPRPAGRAGGPDADPRRGRPGVPAGRRRPLDDAPGLRLPRRPRHAARERHERDVRRHLVCRAARLARDRRRRLGRVGRGGRRQRPAEHERLGAADRAIPPT